MQEIDIQALWSTYDKKLETNLSLHRQHTIDITHIKVQSLLAAMQPIKIFTLLVGFAWVFIVDNIIINLWQVASPYFLISAIIQVLLTKIAIGVYIYQLILIRQVDINGAIIDTQEKLAQLKSSTIWVTRLLFLQLPVWTTFYLTKNTLMNGSTPWLLLQLFVTASCSVAAIWLFTNIRQDNKDKKWFRLLFAGKEWTPVIHAMDLLTQLKDYRKE